MSFPLPLYKFLKRQIRWSGIPISWRIFHSLLDLKLITSQWTRNEFSMKVLCYSGEKRTVLPTKQKRIFSPILIKMHANRIFKIYLKLWILYSEEKHHFDFSSLLQRLKCSAFMVTVNLLNGNSRKISRYTLL